MLTFIIIAANVFELTCKTASIHVILVPKKGLDFTPSNNRPRVVLTLDSSFFKLNLNSELLL